MEVYEAIYGRRAVRSLTAELVAEALMRRVIDAAIQAPSSGYRQPWITKESGMCR